MYIKYFFYFNSVWHFQLSGGNQRDPPAEVQQCPQGQQVLPEAPEEGGRLHSGPLRRQGEVPGDGHAREEPRSDAPGHSGRAEEQLHGLCEGTGGRRSRGRVQVGHRQGLLQVLLRVQGGGEEAQAGKGGR